MNVAVNAVIELTSKSQEFADAKTAIDLLTRVEKTESDEVVNIIFEKDMVLVTLKDTTVELKQPANKFFIKALTAYKDQIKTKLDDSLSKLNIAK
jgi:hypothetical protein